MPKKTFQKPRDYINRTKEELAEKVLIDPYNVFYECEIRIGKINEQDLELVKISISSLETILDDIDEHNCVNLLTELGKLYSEDELNLLLKERKSELNKALGNFVTGMASIKTNPKARVLIKGKDFGVTPLTKIVLPVGSVLLEFECTVTGECYSKKIDIEKNVIVLINTTNNEQQKVKELIKEFNKEIEKQAIFYIPSYISFIDMMYDCEWDSKLSLEKMLEQGRLLSEERKKTGIRRFVQRKKGFSDGYYDVKFWEIHNTGLEIETQYGSIYTSSPRKNTKIHINKPAAEKDFEKKIKVKLKNGYEEEI
ncbi:hypothetical protein [Tenacibaculum salmonis]|uniref:hypothetical protein n=1 Tax=Tenacibaculum sp. P3-BQ1 TaxID=3232310 RepID=UPI0034DE2CC7